jgi:uncharacterized protein (TIGR03437 family)
MLASRDAVVTAAKTSMPASSAIIDVEGRYVVYETATTPHQLILYDLAAGWELPLVWADEGCTQPALSDDGLQLLFLSAANWEADNDRQRTQAWLFDLNTGELRQLTQDMAGVAEATLSGDGQVVWAVTLAGRLLRIEVNSDAVTEIVGRTVALDSQRDICARGSQCGLTGRGLAPGVFTAMDPLPVELGGIEVKADGVPLPLVSVAPDEIRFVLPWELQTGEHQLEVTPGDSIFQEKNVLTETVSEMDPALYLRVLDPHDEPYALHEDLRGPVTNSDPARPGEVVHVFASGLGPVSPAVATNGPGPSEPRAKTVRAWAWSVRDGFGEDRPAEVLFSGLAPGQFGVYQVDIRLPARLTNPELLVSVSYPQSSAHASAWLMVLPNAP